MQLVREHSVTVISAHWATVDCSWPKEWKSVCELISTLKKRRKKKRRRGMNSRTISQNPCKQGKSHHHHSRQGWTTALYKFLKISLSKKSKSSFNYSNHFICFVYTALNMNIKRKILIKNASLVLFLNTFSKTSLLLLINLLFVISLFLLSSHMHTLHFCNTKCKFHKSDYSCSL